MRRILSACPARRLLLIVCCLLFAACLSCQSIDQPTPSKTIAEGPDQEGWNSTIMVTSNGRVTALVKYHRMEKFSKKRRVFFKDSVTVDFYNHEGQHSSRLTAERGVMNEETGDVTALDNVVVISDSGISLRSDSLRWDNRRQKVVTDAFVKIATASGDTLYGVGFESDPNLKHWYIRKPSGVTQKKLALPAQTPRVPAPAGKAETDSVPRATGLPPEQKTPPQN